MHDNSEHLVPTTAQFAGKPIEITFIDVHRKVVPAGIPRPYEYVATIKETRRIQNALTKIIAPLAPKLQYGSADLKLKAKGCLFRVWALGYKPGFTGDPDTGVVKEEWDKMTSDVQVELLKQLGPDAKMFIDPYKEKHKFQMRFDGYIMYKEFYDLDKKMPPPKVKRPRGKNRTIIRVPTPVSFGEPSDMRRNDEGV